MKKFKERKIMTEALAVKNGKLLLGRKKRSFGKGKWLGFGGKVEEGESLEDALKRECLEECSIKLKKFEKRGVLTFYYTNDPEMEVHYFEMLEYDGEPKESDEMEVGWFETDKIPYDKMFPNDYYWLPMFLKKEFFEGEFWFDKDYKIKKHKINKI
jgi:8-oxo-dGTP diphosphatase/2-hydroxy-dATP diphosphatase